MFSYSLLILVSISTSYSSCLKTAVAFIFSYCCFMMNSIDFWVNDCTRLLMFYTLSLYLKTASRSSSSVSLLLNDLANFCMTEMLSFLSNYTSCYMVLAETDCFSFLERISTAIFIVIWPMMLVYFLYNSCINRMMIAICIRVLTTYHIKIKTYLAFEPTVIIFEKSR